MVLLLNSYQAIGSSLQAQGTPMISIAFFEMVRFIPAGAGNTTLKKQSFVLFRGSSLQAQGTQIPHISGQPIQRFIPAGAGNTTNRPRCSRGIAVHPCRRREHASMGCRITSKPRFIPAGAGNTQVKYQSFYVIPVHPCRRREHGLI